MPLFALICAFLWGCGYSVVKSGYAMWNVAADDVPAKILFAGIRFLNFASEPETAIFLGAYYKPFIIAGEFWRFLTAGFVHIDLWHILMNMLALRNLGMFMEKITGRWRYLVHDMDYSMGMYEQPELMANYDTLGHVLKEGDERYSPLFAALMQRPDCRRFFRGKILEYADGALDGEHIREVLAELNGSRYLEQMQYYKHLENLRNAGDGSIWTYSGHLSDMLDIIKNFADAREGYMLEDLEEHLPALSEEETTAP